MVDRPATGAEVSALEAQVRALERLIDEREDRTKERFSAMKIAVEAALAAADRAVSKAETATDKRFDGVNEFRETLRDQANNLLPRSEYNVQHMSFVELVNNTAIRITALENRVIGISVAETKNRANAVDQSTRILSMIAIAVAVGVGVIEILLRGH